MQRYPYKYMQCLPSTKVRGRQIEQLPHHPTKIKMKVTSVAVPVLAGLASANPIGIEERQSCPQVHVFGARETTVPQGYGTSQGLVNMVKQAYPGSTSEAIVYPACGGQPQCGGVSYDNSATQGTAAVVRAVTDFNRRCPDTKIVLIGYSQVRSADSSWHQTRPLTKPWDRAGKSWTTRFAVAPVLPSAVRPWRR